MHTYSTDNDKRPTIYGILGFAAYLLVLGMGWATSLLGSGLPAIAGGTISWGIAFAGLSAVYSKYGWKTTVARAVGASRVPDYSGEWEGYIKTSYGGDIDEGALHTSNESTEKMQRKTATLYIDQTWRKINIHLSTTDSESDSTGATILTNDGHWPSLTYQYGNQPNADSEESMAAHDGTADLSLKQVGDDDVLEGFYYTGPGRENYGKMRFKRRS